MCVCGHDRFISNGGYSKHTMPLPDDVLQCKACGKRDNYRSPGTAIWVSYDGKIEPDMVVATRTEQGQ